MGTLPHSQALPCEDSAWLAYTVMADEGQFLSSFGFCGRKRKREAEHQVKYVTYYLNMIIPEEAALL